MSMRVGEKSHHDKPLEFPAKLEHLYEMLTYIKETAITIGFSKTVVSKIELAGEEALVNVISHGFINDAEDGKILILCQESESKSLIVKIIDNGVPFNPLQAIKNFNPDDPDSMKDSVEGSQIGGYGIYFIVNMMDNVAYEHSEGMNVLTLTKHFS